MHRHLITLFAFVVSMRAKNVLELGVRRGCSTLPLLLGVKETGGFLTSVDLNDHKFNCPKEFNSYWKFIKSDSLKYLSSMDNQIIFDVVFIDDWHACAHVKEELELIEKHVLPSSIILLHDLMAKNIEPKYTNYNNIKSQSKYLPRKEWGEGGPYKAVSELDPEKWEFATIPVCNGLTLLRKKLA
jgi:predicted O-methyltransferase YrrM